MEAVVTFRVFLNIYQTVRCHCIGISTIYTCYTEHFSKYWFLFLCPTCEQNSSSTKELHMYVQGITTKWKKLFINLKNNLNHYVIVWRIFQLQRTVVSVLVRISNKTNQWFNVFLPDFSMEDYVTILFLIFSCPNTHAHGSVRVWYKDRSLENRNFFFTEHLLQTLK